MSTAPTAHEPWPSSVADLDAWLELSARLRLGDGLPVLPPTREAVAARVRASGRAGDEVLGEIPPRGAEASVEAIAANAAMAGCPPACMPVVLAAVEALLDASFNLNGVQVTTHPCWPLAIVSGPVVASLGLASAESVFSGGGSFASVGIGRALRLVLWNLGGAHPGELVKETLGHPGRFAYCIAERLDPPWTAFHEARGCARGASAITMFACEAPQSVAYWGLGADPEARLAMVADQMRARGNNNTHTMGECLVALSPAEVRLLAARGYTRERTQQRLFELSKRRLGEIRPQTPGGAKAYEWWPDSIDQNDPDALVPVVDGPESIHLVVTGGDSIPWAAVCPGWGHLGGLAVTRPIES